MSELRERKPASGRSQLRDDVASYLRTLIFSGQVKPGTFLRLDPIAEHLEISVTPVREAMLMLGREGYIVQVPRRGFAVADLSRGDLRDQFVAQGMIGGELCARATHGLDDVQVGWMRENMVALDSAIAHSNNHAIEQSIKEFHRLVNSLADSSRLARILGLIASQNPTEFLSTIEGQVEASRREHAGILEALEARDGEAARQLMSQHIAGIGEFVIGSLEMRGFWGPES